MVNEHILSTRYRAVLMVNGGLIQVQVNKQLKIGQKIFNCWMALDRRRETLENQNRGWRKMTMSPVAKNVVAMSTLTRHQ